MRISEAALALITRENDRGQREYLAQWNRRWGAYSLVGGHREGAETFRACCMREVGEELGIRADTDFVVADEPVAPSCEYVAHSGSTDCETKYTIQLFNTDLKIDPARIAGDNRWLREGEILAGESAGRPVARQVGTVLRMCGILRVPQVGFSDQAREKRLPPQVRELIAADLLVAFYRLSPERVLQAMQVVDLFTGFTPDFPRKATVGVEVTFADGHERHIVKVGDRRSVESDYTGWRQCTDGRNVASRIFAPVRMVNLPEGRAAVVYRDAFSLFGPGEGKSAPVLLEEAVHWSVTDERPDALSAERAISQIFTDLGTWFYPHSVEEQTAAGEFYQRQLGKPAMPGGPDVLRIWETDPHRLALRRHAVWVLCGRDAPDADPVERPARYLDPVDFLRWSMRDGRTDRIPPSLVGCGHGDLHARNILVGVRRGEIQYPAGFDYEDMGSANLLAWDFAKFETELKVRLLPEIVCDQPDTEVLDWLLSTSGLRTGAGGAARDGALQENAMRADRMAAFLAFEELLYDRSKCIQGRKSVEYILKRSAGTGVRKLDCLAEIVLRIRQEAAYWLGFKPPGRQLRWQDELYHALGVYGLLNARWNYTTPEQECALVSAGAALARMPATPGYIRRAIDVETGFVGPVPPGADRHRYPSYRVLLAAGHADWRARNHAGGLARTRGRVLEGSQKLSVVPAMQHAVPLIGHALLFQLEDGQLAAAEPLLEQLEDEAATFLDHETLARVGRLYKDVADRETGNGNLLRQARNGDPQERPPFMQMYHRSFQVYRRAYTLTKDWYVGINAATVALLSGREEEARDIAQQVALTCAAELDHARDNRYWLFATEGEAAIILGRDAVRFYEAALRVLTPGQAGMAESSYRQAIRLWCFLDGGRPGPVDAVLNLFESSGFKDALSRGFLGRNP